MVMVRAMANANEFNANEITAMFKFGAIIIFCTFSAIISAIIAAIQESMVIQVIAILCIIPFFTYGMVNYIQIRYPKQRTSRISKPNLAPVHRKMQWYKPDLVPVRQRLQWSEARQELRVSSPISNRTLPISNRTLYIRTIRVSSSHQKHHKPMEQSFQVLKNLGIAYSCMEDWRDNLRQWFSEVLLKPLVQKIDTSHLQVMQAAAKLGLTVNVPKLGSNEPASLIAENKRWRTLEEDAVLYQLKALLIQARDAPNSQPSLNPLVQECIDVVTEHQRLCALMRGEWVNGLLPQKKTVTPEYIVQRIRELAEGTCVKNFDYSSINGWSSQFPIDSHLLIYLFCAFLEHPQWMLHVDSATYPSAHFAKNPFFINMLPLTKRYPEKYVAVLSSPPNSLDPEACVLVVGKHSSPIFTLYWDSKLQFSLQEGRTGLWDAILLLCRRIKMAHGGVVRGISLASSTLNIMSIFEGM